MKEVAQLTTCVVKDLARASLMAAEIIEHSCLWSHAGCMSSPLFLSLLTGIQQDCFGTSLPRCRMEIHACVLHFVV